MEPKRLYRSRTNRMVLGVCGGMGEYLNIDPTIIRLLFVLFAFTSTSIILYLACMFVIPEQA